MSSQSPWPESREAESRPDTPWGAPPPFGYPQAPANTSAPSAPASRTPGSPRRTLTLVVVSAVALVLVISLGLGALLLTRGGLFSPAAVATDDRSVIAEKAETIRQDFLSDTPPLEKISRVLRYDCTAEYAEKYSPSISALTGEDRATFEDNLSPMIEHLERLANAIPPISAEHVTLSEDGTTATVTAVASKPLEVDDPETPTSPPLFRARATKSGGEWSLCVNK